MAQSKQESSGINISMCKIKKEVAGNHLVTTGSACVLRWPWEIEFASSKAQGKNRTFVVTTSEVFSQRDSNSKTAWRADFLPLTRWSRSEKFSLNGVTVHEVPVPSQKHAITLTFIPTETLHNQKTMSKWRTDQLKTSRAKLCHHKDETCNEAADRKQLLCFVLLETTLEDDKFSLRCYVLCRNESGSYFLHDHGNKAEIRTLKDFHSSEKPRGSVILNESGHVVGLLAFGDIDEILPLFFAENMQGDDPSTHVESNTENSNKAPSQECSGSDGHDMQSDANQNAEKQFPFNNNGRLKLKREHEGASDESSRHSITTSDGSETGLQSGIGDPDSGLQGVEINQQMRGNKHQPQELSFCSIVPQTMEGTGVVEEELRHPLQCQTEGTLTHPVSGVSRRSHSTMTPRPQRSQRELSEIPLKSDTRVEDVILHKVYLMDAISRHLDMSCKGIQNWSHLASLHDVSVYLRLKCQTGEHHSRSEKMFDLLSAEDPDLLIGTLKQHLRDLKINNVEHYIK